MDENLNSPQRRLIALRMEHADLDDLIDRNLLASPADELTLRRLKKRRLLLRIRSRAWSFRWNRPNPRERAGLPSVRCRLLGPAAGPKDASLNGNLAQAVGRAFAADGPLARSDPHFLARPAQDTLDARIAQAVAGRETLVAEAGTGVGKTFAYLVPLLLSGRRGTDQHRHQEPAGPALPARPAAPA